MSLILADLKFTKLFHKFELMLFDQGPFFENKFIFTFTILKIIPVSIVLPAPRYQVRVLSVLDKTS